MKRFRALAITASLAILLTLAVAVPAGAEDANLRVCTKEGSCAEVHNLSMITVCDRDRDGRKVRAWWHSWMLPYSEPLPTGWATRSPADGSPRCHTQGSTLGQPIFDVRVCVEEQGCTRWMKV